MRLLLVVVCLTHIFAFAAPGPNCELPGNFFAREVDTTTPGVPGMGGGKVTGRAADLLTDARGATGRINEAEAYMKYAREVTDRDQVRRALEEARKGFSHEAGRHNTYGKSVDEIDRALARLKADEPLDQLYRPAGQPVRAVSSQPVSAPQAPSGPAPYRYSDPPAQSFRKLPPQEKGATYQVTSKYGSGKTEFKGELISDNGEVLEFRVIDGPNRGSTQTISRNQPATSDRAVQQIMRRHDGGPLKPEVWAGKPQDAQMEALERLTGRGVEVKTSSGTFQGDIVSRDARSFTIEYRVGNEIKRKSITYYETRSLHEANPQGYITIMDVNQSFVPGRH
ncbi:MAG: hypothetical protein ABL958_07515 [Bdellovibrionia bacterium]